VKILQTANEGDGAMQRQGQRQRRHRKIATFKIFIIDKKDASSKNHYRYCNNSIQFFIIYVPSQQPQGQLQTQHSTDNYIMDTHNIKSRVNCRST
jgi:hypothetical protein